MSIRTDRISSVIYQKLSWLLLSELSDPDLKDIRITRIELSGDLRVASIFFSSNTSHREPKKILSGFKRATPFIKNNLRSVDLRYIPELKFFMDKDGESVLNLLNELERGRVH